MGTDGARTYFHDAMARLDIERQRRLEPIRIAKAIESIEALGIRVNYKDSTKIMFEFKGSNVTYFPYSGWATGKPIHDGRGLQNLLKQLKNTQ